MFLQIRYYDFLGNCNCYDVYAFHFCRLVWQLIFADMMELFQVEQLKQKEDKRDRSIKCTIVEDYSGRFFPCSKGLCVLCCVPFSDEPRIPLQLGEQVIVTRWRRLDHLNFWLIIFEWYLFYLLYYILLCIYFIYCMFILSYFVLSVCDNPILILSVIGCTIIHSVFVTDVISSGVVNVYEWCKLFSDVDKIRGAAVVVTTVTELVLVKL